MSQRLKARERQLAERVDREETDVVRRIQGSPSSISNVGRWRRSSGR